MLRVLPKSSSLCDAVLLTEHIKPLSREGRTEVDNLALACQGCNGYKYNKTDAVDPATKRRVPLFNPRHQRWIDHFLWSEDYSLVFGITPIGRATVAALRLNRDNVVNLRRALYTIGKHPPVLPPE